MDASCETAAKNRPVREYEHEKTNLNVKTIRLTGAVTDLEDRHSMALECFFNLLGKYVSDKRQSLQFVLVQSNLQDLMDFIGFQAKLYRFEVHAFPFGLRRATDARKNAMTRKAASRATVHRPAGPSEVSVEKQPQ